MNSKISIMSRITSTTAPKNVDPPCHMMISSVGDDECKPEDGRKAALFTTATHH